MSFLSTVALENEVKPEERRKKVVIVTESIIPAVVSTLTRKLRFRKVCNV